jgi:CRISPR type I-E-associated protein CasB/Cse2
MTHQHTNPKERAAQLLTYLRQLKEDRGAMAELRRALTPTQRHRAWPLLARVGGIDEPRYETVAGLFASHPLETGSGNLGVTCRLLSGDHNTFEGRFRRLLACDRDAICAHVRPVVLAAKAKGLPVNFEQLFADLSYWSDRVKAQWAAEYWGAPLADTPQVPAEATP